MLFWVNSVKTLYNGLFWGTMGPVRNLWLEHITPHPQRITKHNQTQPNTTNHNQSQPIAHRGGCYALSSPFKEKA